MTCEVSDRLQKGYETCRLRYVGLFQIAALLVSELEMHGFDHLLDALRLRKAHLAMH
jgi:hypothetical protein